MNIFCPNCENECSAAAAVCPKCGHPLMAPEGGRVAARRPGRLPGWGVRFGLALAFSLFGVGVLVATVLRDQEIMRRYAEIMSAEARAMYESRRDLEERALAMTRAMPMTPAGMRMSLEMAESIVRKADRDVTRFPAVMYETSIAVRAAFAGAGLSEEDLTKLVLAESGGARILAELWADLESRK